MKPDLRAYEAIFAGTGRLEKTPDIQGLPVIRLNPTESAARIFFEPKNRAKNINVICLELPNVPYEQ